VFSDGSKQPIRNMLLNVEAIRLPSTINGLATHHCASFPIIVGRSRQNQSKKSGADIAVTEPMADVTD
jgi:hypothetical protein